MLTVLNLDMVVKERRSKKVAGKPRKYQLVLEDGSNNRLVLVSDSSAIYEGFPENVMFQVKVAKVQAVLGETLEHEVDQE